MCAHKPRYLFFIFFFTGFLSLSFCYGQNYVFAQLTGSPMNTNGWSLQGDARVTNVTGIDNSELLLCSTGGASGAAFYRQLINLSLCKKWIAEFDFRMYDGSGADGIAFCFLDVPPVGFITGGGLGIPATANGLKICFDTWNNCIPFNPATVHQDMPKIEIRWGRGYNDESNPSNPIVGECLSGPTKSNTDGSLSFIRSQIYNHAKITYDDGNIQVFVNNTQYLTGSQKFNFAGYLGFTASTGGYNDNHSIKNVIIYTQMPPSFAGNAQNICPYDTIQIGGPANDTYIYSWSPSVGLSDPSVSAPYLHIPIDSAITQIYSYQVKTSFKDNPGCASADSVEITVFPKPQVHFVTPQICLTDAVAQFLDSTYTRDINTMPFSYVWDFGDPNAPPNINESSLANPSHRYSAASNYPVTLKVTNGKGCSAALTKIFTVNGAVPKADYGVNNPTALCSNHSVELVNSSSVDFGSITRIKIFWGDSSTVSYVDSQPYPGKLYSHNYPNPVASTPASYNIRMLSFSGISCSDELDRVITVQASPHVQFSAVPHICVYDSPLVINQGKELTGLTGSPSYFGNGISSDGLFSPSDAGAGVSNLMFRFNATDGCTDSAFQTIAVIAPPVLNAGNDTSVVINQPLQLQARTEDFAGDLFLWTPPAWIDNPGIANPIATFNMAIDSIRYFVKATDTAGCYSESSLLVKVFNTLPDIFVPNAFTPGSTRNNIFRPIPVGISSLQYFRVYNRWGQMVYSTSQLGQGWDGTLGGKPLEPDGFVWMVQGITYTGKPVFKKGTVTLIR